MAKSILNFHFDYLTLGGGRGQVSARERRPHVQPDPGGDQERRPEEDGES